MEPSLCSPRCTVPSATRPFDERSDTGSARDSRDVLRPDSYLMRFSDGTVFHGGPDIKIGGQPITRFGCLTFNDDSVRALIADFHEAVVEHYQSRWPSGTVLNYMTCADPTMETEYSCAGYLDFSRYAKVEYRTWLQQRYGTIGALNAAWGTKYTSFSQVNPYFNTKAPKPDRDPRWLDWVRFRSFSLKRFIDEMADRVHAADPDAEYGVQFGGGLWHTPWIRNLFELETLVENCDWVVNYGRQDFPNQFDADVNRGILPDKKLIAELDGPHFGFTDTQNLNCGKAAFNRGYVAVELANWAYQGLDTLRDPQWTFLATLASMGTGKVPKITPVGTIDANVSDLYAWHDTTTWRDAIYAQWKTLTSNGAKIADVKYHDDLTR